MKVKGDSKQMDMKITQQQPNQIKNQMKNETTLILHKRVLCFHHHHYLEIFAKSFAHAMKKGYIDLVYGFLLIR